MTYKLLLADDEDSIRKVLTITLSDSGYQVVSAKDGKEALDLFREENPSIVLTDIKMPGMTGVELLGRIKSERPDTEVIMISGHGDMDLAIESLKHDATDFITKPINDDALEIALKRAKERISMREQLRLYTENLEALVEEQSAKLVEAERVAAVSKAFEGLSSAIWNIAGDLEGGIDLFNEMPCLVSIHNPEVKVVAVNQLYRDRFGDKVGSGSWEIYKGSSGSKNACPVAQTFKTAMGQRSQELVEYESGKEAPIIVHTAPVKDSKGQVELVLEISADMTEIKRLQDELQATQQSYQQLFDEVPCYITVQDREFKLTAGNRQFKEDFDYSAGSRCYQVYKHRNSPCPECPVEKTFQDGQSHQTEMVVTSKAGDQYNVLISTAPIRDQDGEITQVMEMSTNITEIRQLQDHLSSIGLKIGTISHGIKGLLTGLDAGMYDIDSGISKEDQNQIQEGWDTVKLMIGRIRNMALEILFYAKERDLKWERVDALSFAKDVAFTIDPKMKKQSIQFNCDFEPSVGAFEIDTSVVRTALINILENAIDACVEDGTKKQKKIALALTQDKENIIFSVEDNGIGMDQETKDNLFALFFSSKGSRGTGLGLYISKQIIQQHGGAIKVTSDKGVGSKFVIKIPKTIPKAIRNENSVEEN